MRQRLRINKQQFSENSSKLETVPEIRGSEVVLFALPRFTTSMMTRKLGIPLLVAILAIGSLSSFADTADFQSSGNKKEELLDRSDASNESNDDSKEKRSQETIMFGNQQNKAIVVAGELVGMGENPDHKVRVSENMKDSEDGNGTKKPDMDADDAKIEDALKGDKGDDNDKKHLPVSLNSDNLEMGPSESAEWYNSVPVAPDALQYLLNTAPLQPIHDVNGLYDQEELYRRKRQLRPKALRKRSLRSPLGQMIQMRGRRLPRRSMRFKRQVDMQDLLSLLNNAEPNNEEKFYEQTTSSNFNNYRYPEQTSFRHSYNFVPHENYLDEDLTSVMDDINDKKDEDELLSYPQTSAPMGSRYFDPDDFQLLDARSRTDEENGDFHQSRNWMEPGMMPTSQSPSIFTVSRRSSPLFYPIDYRFVPGFKKRSSFSGRGRNDEQETEFGKWGRVVNVPEAYASAEDVARLYDLASLLAENENPEVRTRRSV